MSKTSKAEPKALLVFEFAERVNRSQSTIRTLVKRGKLPTIEKRWPDEPDRIDEKLVAVYLKEHGDKPRKPGANKRRKPKGKRRSSS